MVSMQFCARGLMLTPDRQLLLMEMVGGTMNLWIMPGGRIEPGEDALTALNRELREETGRADFEVGPLLWIRQGTVAREDGPLIEEERFFLVRCEHFTPDAGGLEAEERSRFLRFRWWSFPEIQESEEAFVPRELGGLLAELERHGPPGIAVRIIE